MMPEMTDMPESSDAPGDSQEPIRLPAPKRGAFPTPKSEIEKAKQYLPGIDDEDDPEEEPALPTDIDDGNAD
jgi:hypothetical protein